MCRLVVDGQQRIVCADATRESRFSYSSFVSGDEPVRFYASIPVRAVDGSVVGTLCAWDTRSFELDGEQLARFEDLAAEVSTRIELTHIATALEYASSRDPLTGAVNRLVLADRLAHAFSRQLRHDLDVLVVAVDIDRFKQINDTYGHDAGDEVLVAVAQRLTASTRPEDTVARLGGDEFAVVAEMLPSARIGPVEFVARLEAAFAEPIPIGGEPMVIGVSIGAGFAVPGDDVREALARADVAMYERKARHGRPSSR
jgi:diguanylate cyclase (GGDEF)-like protein